MDTFNCASICIHMLQHNRKIGKIQSCAYVFHSSCLCLPSFFLSSDSHWPYTKLWRLHWAAVTASYTFSVCHGQQRWDFSLILKIFMPIFSSLIGPWIYCFSDQLFDLLLTFYISSIIAGQSCFIAWTYPIILTKKSISQWLLN